MKYYYSRPNFRFYPEEIRDMGIAITVLTFAMTILFRGLDFYSYYFYLPIAFVAVITGFFAHELSHKYVAFRLGYPAAFRSWNIGLFIAFITSFFGFLFAAPGAVVVYGYPSREENGKISAAGPISNIIIGTIFFIFAILFPLFQIAFFYIYYLNFFLAFFNLLPIPPMDGVKILHWNLSIYIVLLILSLFGVVIPYIP